MRIDFSHNMLSLSLAANESHKISISGLFSYDTDLIPAFITENIHFMNIISYILAGNLQTACRVSGQSAHITFGIKNIVFSTLARNYFSFLYSWKLQNCIGNQTTVATTTQKQ